MVQIPDSLRQQLAPVVKHHFWILACLVPLLLLPALFLANGERRAVIAREKATIDGHVSALNGVRNEPNHPNQEWSNRIDGLAAGVKEELKREWTAFWNSQGGLRAWPKALGQDFLTAITAVESGGRRELQFRDLQRYQNTVPDIVRQLPERMGCEELMTNQDEDAGGPLGRGGRPPGVGGGSGDDEGDDPDASRPLPILEWRPEDQKRLIGSFTWDKPPSTTQVLLAQEELWVYGLFCDAIRNVNEGATGHFDSRITQVEELAVGYPAAEDAPGGQGTGRVIGPPTAPGGGPPGGPLGGLDAGGLPPDGSLPPGQSSATPQGRPSHPRFGGFAGAVEAPAAAPPGLVAPLGGPAGAGEPGGEPKGPAVSADDMLRQWIYADFSGRPLTAQELKTKPDARFVHLMPFVLRVVVDQRQIDRLLAQLAASDVPIDVRQVRINPSGQAFNDADFGRFGGGGFGPDGGSSQGQRRPFDVTVELRGTVGLATKPEDNAFEPSAGKDPAQIVVGGP